MQLMINYMANAIEYSLHKKTSSILQLYIIFACIFIVAVITLRKVKGNSELEEGIKSQKF